MCGRASLTASPEEVAAVFDVAVDGALAPRFNIAPTQPLWVVTREGATRTLRAAHFGLVPAWEPTSRAGAKHVNARYETMLDKALFRGPATSHRCLVVVDGFYEWQRVGGARRPYHVAFEDGAPFALAGLFSRFATRDGEVVESACVVTGPAHATVAAIHDREPLFVPPTDYDAWLDAKADPMAVARALAATEPAWRLRAVSTFVNDPRHEGPACLAPADDGPPPVPTPGTLPLFGEVESAPRPRRKAR